MPDQISSEPIPSVNQPGGEQVQAKKSHGLIIVLVIVFVSLLASTGWFGYQYWQMKQQVQETQPAAEQAQTAQSEETDPTADWQTYTNKEYGFEFKYPIGWESYKDDVDGKMVEDSNNDIVLTLYYVGSKGGIGGLQTIDNYCQSYHKYGSDLKSYETQVDKIPAVYCINEDNQDDTLPSSLFMIQKDDSQYDIAVTFNKDGFEENLGVFKQILSTFRFLDEERAGLGRVEGKLCYPSELIPPGVIVAKSVGTGKKYTQNYLGTDSGAGINYTLDLQPDIYVFRFEVRSLLEKDSQEFPSGYYTTCALKQTNCSETDHLPIKVRVESGKTESNIDLCDFYFPGQENEPEF